MYAEKPMLRTNGSIINKTNNYRSSMYTNSPSASTSTSSNSTNADMPQINSNNRWALWVKETVDDQPTPTASATAVIPDTRKPRMTERVHNNTNNKSDYIVPSNDQIDLVISDPIRCFCGKPAYRSYTLEYGPILECGTFAMEESDNQITKFICGFHVHETSWISFREQLKAGNTITSEYSELRTCPRYNFSYCAMFHIKNQYTLDAPTKLPHCFCRRPIVMRVNQKDGILFTCRNAFIDGVRKCSWILNAKEVAFLRPKQRIHNYIDEDKYFSEKERQKNALLRKRTDQKLQQREQHKNDLLATLSASVTQEAPPRQLSASITMASEDHDKDNVISFRDLTLQEQKLQAGCLPTSKSLMVPTCVMSNQKKRNQKQDEPVPSSTSSSNSSSSSTITSPVMSSQNPLLSSSEETHMLKMTCDKQHSIIEQQKEIIERQKDKLKQAHETKQQATNKIARFKDLTTELQTKLFRCQNDQDEENILRMQCQERLSNIEMDVVRLMNEKEKLVEELMIHIEEKNNMDKEEELNKCRLCYTKNIEYCLIPCYHFAYCQLCAAKLTECAICRRSIEGIQKIYTC